MHVIQRQKERENEVQKSEETEQIQEQSLSASISPLRQTATHQHIQRNPSDNEDDGGYWAFSTKVTPEMQSMSKEELVAYCHFKVTGLSQMTILDLIHSGDIIISGSWSVNESTEDGYFKFNISKSLYTQLTGYISNGADGDLDEERQAELSDVPLFNTGTTEQNTDGSEGSGSGIGAGNGQGTGSGVGTGSSRSEERGEDGRRTGASERDAEFKTLPPEEQRAITQETDRIFRETNDWEADRLIQDSDPEQYKEFWLEIRDNLLIDRQRLDQLPERVQSIIKPGGRKVAPKDYPKVKMLLQYLVQLDDTQLETLDRLLNSGDAGLRYGEAEFKVEDMIDLAQFMKNFTPGDYMEYMDQVNGQTSDLAEFRASIERFIERKFQKQQEVENFENVKTKLFGLEELYAAYKAFKASEGANAIAKSAPGDKTDKLIMRNDLRRSGLDDAGIASKRASLTEQMQANGFESISEFQSYIPDYEKAFEQSAVRLAEDHLLRYRHLLYEEEKKLNDEAYLDQLLQEIQGSGAKGHYEKADQHSENVRNLSSPDDHISDPYAGMKAAERSSAASERRAGESAIQNNVSSFLVKEEQFDHEELAHQNSKAALKEQLQDYIEEKYESINETWTDLHENSEYIYKLDKLFAANIQAQGIEEGSIFDSIIKDKAERIADA